MLLIETHASPRRWRPRPAKLAANEFLRHRVLMNVDCVATSSGEQVRNLMKSQRNSLPKCSDVKFPVNRSANYMCFMSLISHFHYADARCDMDLLSYVRI